MRGEPEHLGHLVRVEEVVGVELHGRNLAPGVDIGQHLNMMTYVNTERRQTLPPKEESPMNATASQKNKIEVLARRSGYADTFSEALARCFREELRLGPQKAAQRHRAFSKADATLMIDFLDAWEDEVEGYGTPATADQLAEAKNLLRAVSHAGGELAEKAKAALEALD